MSSSAASVSVPSDPLRRVYRALIEGLLNNPDFPRVEHARAPAPDAACTPFVWVSLVVEGLAVHTFASECDCDATMPRHFHCGTMCDPVPPAPAGPPENAVLEVFAAQWVASAALRESVWQKQRAQHGAQRN